MPANAIDTTGARAESLAHDVTLYVWPHADRGQVTFGPKLIVAGPAGDVEISWSTRGECFSARAPALRTKGLRDAALTVFCDGRTPTEIERGHYGAWPQTRHEDVRRSDDRAPTSAMRVAGMEAVRSALLYVRGIGAFDRLVDAAERFAAEGRVAEIDAELATMAAERAALIARLAR